MGVQRHWAIISIVLSVLGTPCLLQASGFRLFDQSASGTARTTPSRPKRMIRRRFITTLPGCPRSEACSSRSGRTWLAAPPRSERRRQTATGDFGGRIASPPPSTFYLTANLPIWGSPR